MDRTETAYQRLKNYPAIVSWSIGNEMTYTNDPNWANGLQRDIRKSKFKRIPAQAMGERASSRRIPAQALGG